jgi:hypothetical protein
MGNLTNRKEVIAMKYEKPEVVLSESATKAVKEIGKGSPDSDNEPTDAAYKADEQ